MTVKVTHLKAPESYTSFEPDVDVSAERECAHRIAFDCLEEVAKALTEGRKPIVKVPALDPLFAAVTGKALHKIARRFSNTDADKNENITTYDIESKAEAQGSADASERNENDQQ